MRLFRLFLACSLLTVPAWADESAKAHYMGGTLSIPEKAEGRFDLNDEARAVFRSKKGEAAVPFKTIESIEYGQKAGRRVGAAVVISPLFLFSKGRKHFVTISYLDESGTKQGAVFQVDKGGIHRLVTTLSARSGKEIEYESEDAKKHLAKEAK